MSTNFETSVSEIVILSTASETGHVNSRRLLSQDASCTTAKQQAKPAVQTRS